MATEHIIKNHKWQCPECKNWIGEDFNECSICNYKKVKKKRKAQFIWIRFYDRHKERLKIKLYNWRKKNPDKIKLYYKKWYQRKGKKYRQENRKRFLENAKRYYYRHRKEILEKRKIWKK